MNRKRAANRTALEAIGGPRKKRKLDEALESLSKEQKPGTTSTNSSNTSESTNSSSSQVGFPFRLMLVNEKEGEGVLLFL